MAARPLPQAPDAEPRPRLRAVASPRGPSREVIRRRRAAALAVLALLIALPLVLLTGGPGSDRDRIDALLSRGATEPRTLCDHLSTSMATAIGGRDACLGASPERGPAGEVQDIRVTGGAASALVVFESGEELYRLVREDGDWKVDDVR
jgi:hypothetical protein